MKLVLFTKPLADRTLEQLGDFAHQAGAEGYDLCCRASHPVDPENVRTELPRAKKLMEKAGLCLPMVTGPTDLLRPDHPAAQSIMAAMNESGIHLLKLGYFFIDHAREDYWGVVDDIRRQFDGWSRLAAQYQVKVCYHTHSMPQFMGLNAAAIMHLVRGFDPKLLGVYLDPGHLLLDGEHPDMAFNMVREHLAVMGLKDTSKRRKPAAYGSDYAFCRAGFGDVDWPLVFDHLVRLKFEGPLSIHAEFEHHFPEDEKGQRPGFWKALPEEIAFFRRMRDEALSRAQQVKTGNSAGRACRGSAGDNPRPSRSRSPSPPRLRSAR